jgi:hypothetical protein
MSMSMPTSSRANVSAAPATTLVGTATDTADGSEGLRLPLLCDAASHRRPTEGLDGAWELTIELATD